MNVQYTEFFQHFEKSDKEACVKIALDWLSSKTLDVLGLYEDVLKAALNQMTCNIAEKELCIWKEHVSTAIIRTIIECAYPYVIEERDARGNKVSGGKAAVICPDGEYHEIGARIATDYFTILGYDAVFVGSSTPKEELLHAVRSLKPDILAVSVTNYYNLVAAKKTIEAIRSKTTEKIYVIAGGQAFANNPDAVGEIGADRFIQSFSDLEEICSDLRKGKDGGVT